ncbi:MAG: hypothetical protein COB35_13630 [Gammaproteobacteria bacterium]|nr:MAG: hypothetical protein COB35_13630 [Gammaproteobacteria bacterium]
MLVVFKVVRPYSYARRERRFFKKHPELIQQYVKVLKLHAYADNSGIYYNRHLRDTFIEDLVLFDVDSRLKDCGKDDPEPSA